MYKERKRPYPSHRESFGGGEALQASAERTYEERQRSLARLHLKAYESDIVVSRGWEKARALEYVPGKGPGSGLILLGGVGGTGNTPAAWDDGDEDVFSLGGGVSKKDGGIGATSEEVWVDHYDARLLLDSFSAIPLPHRAPSTPEESAPSTPSSTWSDLPEDTEETFLLSPSEAEDYHRTKRRRLIDEAWERRMKERQMEEEEEEAEALKRALEATVVDEEPSHETLVLMQRTAAHLLSASNPAQLEMRILANHGGNDKFTFMREGGRSRNVWLRIKEELAVGKRQEAQAKGGAGLGVLAGYHSSGEDSGVNEDDDSVLAPPPREPPPPKPSSPEAPSLASAASTSSEPPSAEAEALKASVVTMITGSVSADKLNVYHDIHGPGYDVRAYVHLSGEYIIFS
ncbi:hypothetical protein FA15DRAFT_690068 [Coprinopsis marcescibilis]|uniref:SURP motif domain-containing protein n=1 Tax=Coprinopsis marcescibilis TaxID=230819 RepID=A0A5C3K9H7_COPMA|nr:hypothetical protein FA15DRAFT_690068 [Coprinopsis marcescibilis]